MDLSALSDGPRLRRAAARRLVRARKLARQIVRNRRDRPAVPVFILGCGRSGTSMLMDTFERTPAIWVYSEDHPFAFRRYRLRQASTIRRLVRWNISPVVAFKPICDSQHADKILELDPEARALWIYRRYPDVANSAVRKWGEHHRDIIHWIRDGDWKQLDWRGERLSKEAIESVTELYRDDLSPEEGGALVWYLRNLFYFELGLDRDPRVLLVRYEDLVQSPESHFRQIFRFLGLEPGETDLGHLSPRSVRKNPFPPIDGRIETLCDSLTRRLDAAYEAGRSAPAPEVEPERVSS